MSKAHDIADAIIADIADRRGLKWEWTRIDEDIRADIREKWAGIIGSTDVGTKKIVSRTSPREDVARMWANAASRLGWRVVAVFENGGWLRVWAEAPADVNDREVWDGAMPKVGP